MDGRPCTDLYDHSHADPDCGFVHFVYFCFRVGAVCELMETTPRQFGNSGLLHLGRSANHITHDAKNEADYVASNPSFVICAIRSRDGSYIDRR